MDVTTFPGQEESWIMLVNGSLSRIGPSLHVYTVDIIRHNTEYVSRYIYEPNNQFGAGIFVSLIGLM